MAWEYAVGIIVAVIGAGGVGALAGRLTAARLSWRRGYHNIRKEERFDTLREWQELVDRLQQRVDTQEKQLYDLAAKQVECLQREMEHVRREEELKGEVKLLTADVRRLQSRSDDLAPGTVTPTIVTATIEGKIMSVMGSVATLLHWLPNELIGKNLKVLIPDRLQVASENGLQHMRESSGYPDPAKAIITYAKTKEGGEVPVTLHLSGWPDEIKGVRLLNAEITRRFALGDSVEPATKGGAT